MKFFEQNQRDKVMDQERSLLVAQLQEEVIELREVSDGLDELLAEEQIPIEKLRRLQFKLALIRDILATGD